MVRPAGEHHPYCALIYMEAYKNKNPAWRCVCNVLNGYDKWKARHKGNSKLGAEKKIAFVRKYKNEIKRNGVKTWLCNEARKQIGYSDKTVDQDIMLSLENTYRKYVKHNNTKSA